MRFASAIILTWFLGIAWTSADVIYLKDGRTIEGRVQERSENIKVWTVTGASFTLPKTIIVKIEKTPDPHETYQERLDQLKPDDAEGHFKLAQWCDEHQLRDEYGALLEKTLQINPDHAEAKKLLYAYNKFERPIPVNDESTKRLLDDFNPDFKVYRTPHYQICYDTDEVFLSGRARLFERVYERFYRFFEHKGFTLDVIADRLEAVLFNTQQEYVSYLTNPQRQGGPIGGSVGMTAGLYSHGTNRVFFYNAVNETAYQERRKEASAIPSSRLSPLDRQRLEHYKRQLSSIGKQKGDQNISITVHEATHQLTFNLRLLNPKVDNPTWVVEGIALYFETPTDGRWEGPGQVNRQMLKRWRQSNYGPPLNMLLCHDSMFREAPVDTALVCYASAWALTYYLLEERPKDFADYLRVLRAKPPRGPGHSDDRLADFTSIFGPDLDRLASKCQAFMETLR